MDGIYNELEQAGTNGVIMSLFLLVFPDSTTPEPIPNS